MGGSEYENNEQGENKRYAIMSTKKGDLELRVLKNKKEFRAYDKFLKENNENIEAYAEIASRKTPKEIIKEFKRYVPESQSLLSYSPDKEGFSSIIYLAKDSGSKYSFKEAFIKYLEKIDPWKVSF